MLRIRYKDHPTRENTVISINEYVSKRTGARYRVVIDYEAMTYSIRNERTKEFSFKGNTYTNKNALRRAARSKLDDLGVEVGRESRNRTFGRCSVGFTEEKNRKLKLQNKED